MKKLCCCEKAIILFKKGISLLLLIFVSVTAYSGAIDKNWLPKANADFFSKKSFPSLSNPEREKSYSTNDCTYTLNAVSAQLTAPEGRLIIGVTTDGACVWTAISNADSWLSLSTSGRMRGSGTATFSYTENSTGAPRTGTITIAGQTYTVTQAGFSYLADDYEPNNTTAQPATFTPVFTQNASSIFISANCHDESDVDIYKINLGAGHSYLVNCVVYDRHSNLGTYTLAARLVSLTDVNSTWSEPHIPGISNRVVQAGTLYLKIYSGFQGFRGSYAVKIDIKIRTSTGCGYYLSASDKQVKLDAGLDQITVTPTRATCAWTASSNASWIAITSGQSGTGTGSVAYSYQANRATGSRTGTILIADQIYTVTQAGLPLSVDRYEVNNTAAQAWSITPHFFANESAVSISATSHLATDVDFYKLILESGYSYSVSAVLHDLTNQISHSNYTLDASISYSTNADSGWSREEDTRFSLPVLPGGTLYVKIKPFARGGATGTYAAKIDLRKLTSTSCTYSLSPAGKQAAPEAGSDQIIVSTTGLSCVWTATSNASWITLTSGQNGTGKVAYFYPDNRGNDSREGTITIAGQTYMVTQSGRALADDRYEDNNNVTRACALPVSLVQNAGSVSISANCHVADDVDFYKINLPAEFSYTISGVLYEAGNQLNHSNYTLNAKIFTSTNGTTWSYPAHRQIPVQAAPGGFFYLKIVPETPGHTGTYEAKIEITASGCSYSLSAMRKEAAREQGSDRVTVTTTSSCAWTAAPSDTWITLTSGQSGTGNGEVAYNYTANTATTPRTGTITIAGRAYIVAQQGVPSLTADSHEENNTVAQASALTATFTQNASTITIAANCHHADDVDFYKINLGAGHSYTVSAILYEPENQINNSSYTLDVKIFTSTDGSTWSQASDRQFSNLTVQPGILYLKIVPSSQGSTGTYSAKIEITAGCGYLLSATSKQLTSPAGSDRVTVTAVSSCAWTSTSNASWITLTSGQSGTGNGEVGYNYTANTSHVSRIGGVTIAGLTYTLTQAGHLSAYTPDSYEENNTFAQASLLPVAFTQYMCTLSISANCHNAEDVDIYKINLQNGYSYLVSAVLYDYGNDTGYSDYTLFGQIAYSTDGSTWINPRNRHEFSNLSQPGGTFYFKIARYSPPRTRSTGTYGVKLDIKKLAMAGCTYGLSATSSQVTIEEGSDQVTVSTSPTCFWTANVIPPPAPYTPWITITSGESHTGSGNVAFTYLANMAAASRTGTIDIADQTYTVTQVGRPLTTDSYEENNTVAQASELTATFAPNESTVLISANCHINADVDFYKIILASGHSYIVSGALHDADNQINNSNYTLDARISWSTDGSTWSNAEDTRFLNLTVQAGTFYLKIFPLHDNSAPSVGTYAAKIELKRLTTTGCTYSLSATSGQPTFEAGADQVVVTTGATCVWAATTSISWITITSGQSGTGNGNVVYSYHANMGTASRTGTITIAGQTYTVTQTGRPLTADGYEPNNTAPQASALTVSFTQQAGSISFSANCAQAEDVDFYKINLANGYTYIIKSVIYNSYNPINNNNYTLDTKISYSTTGSTWSSPPERQLPGLTLQGGTLYFKIEPFSPGSTGTYGVKIDITATCRYTLSATGKQAALGEGSDRITVTTTSSCAWTATTSEPWITITSGQSGTGNGAVAYNYSENTGADSRTGTITIADQIYTVTQAGIPVSADSYEVNNTVEQASALTVAFTQNVCTLSISANCHQANDVDFYKIILGDGYSYTVSGVLYDMSNPIDNSNYTLNAKISTSTNGSTWGNEEDTQFSGLTMQGGILYLKIASFEAGKKGTYAAKIEIRKLTTTGCTYRLSPVSRQAIMEESAEQAAVETGASCIWTAVSNVPWLTITSGQSETGSGNVGYTCQANRSTASRTGTLEIADQTYTVTQAGRPLTADSYEENNTVAQASLLTAIFNQNAGSVSISANCHNVNDVDFYKIILEAGHSYTISGVLYDLDNPINHSNYTLNAKISTSTNGSTWSEPADRQFPGLIMQEGTLYLKIIPFQEGRVGTYAAKLDIVVDCLYALSPASRQAASSEGTGEVTVTTASSCPWTATSNALWITLTSGQNTTGPGAVSYSYTKNEENAPRTGTLTIAGHTYTLIQDAMSCTYVLSKSSIVTGAEQKEETVEVTTQPGCSWTAASNVAWITVSPDSGTGSSTVTCVIVKNSTEDRTGILTIAGQTVTVNQSLMTGIETTGRVSIFPNPARDFITIDLSAGNIKSAFVKIANQWGQIVYERNNPNGSMQIPLKGLGNGLYFVFLYGEEKTRVQKLVVER